VGLLLDAFNREFGVPTPGPGVLAERLPGVWFPGPAAILEELHVVPARRRAGVGGRLLDRVLVEATARGAGTIEIPVDEGDADARRFYEAPGFSHVHPETGDGRLLYGRDPEP
jgi:GNAT superfamily N-acetyltransferase